MRNNPWLSAIAGSLLWACVPAHAEQAARMVGVDDAKRAEYHWVIHCQGCHGIDAQGSEGGAPPMTGTVAQFLQRAEGRAFLARVPGVAFVSLSDRNVAQLLNWMVQRFDAANMPENFQPYTAEEVRILRRDPFVSRALAERRRILRNLENTRPSVPRAGK